MTRKNRSITFGEELKKLEIAGFVLTETFHLPSVILARHAHECANINLTLKGSFREIIGNRPQECDRASLLIKPAGEHHANQYGNVGAHCLIIEVMPHKLDNIRRFSKLFDSPAHIHNGLLSALAKKLFENSNLKEMAKK